MYPETPPVRTYLGMQCYALLTGDQSQLHPYYLGSGLRTPQIISGLKIEFPKLTAPDPSQLEKVFALLRFHQAQLESTSGIMRAGEYWAIKTPDLKKDLGPKRVFQFAPSGGTFIPFVSFPAHPDDPYPLKAQAQSDYFQWIKANGILTLKALNLESTLEDISFRDRLDSLRKAWIALQLLAQIAPGVTYQGEPLFEVSELRWTEPTAQTAIFEQNYSYGPTAGELQDALDSPTVRMDFDRKMDSNQFLSSWGLTRPEAEGLKPKLAAIEIFFQQLDKWALRQPETMLIDGRTNRLRFEKFIQTVIFDFNHGNNIIYDVKKRKFVVVDA